MPVGLVMLVEVVMMPLPLVEEAFAVDARFGSHHMKAEAHPARKSHAIDPFCLRSPWYMYLVECNL